MRIVQSRSLEQKVKKLTRYQKKKLDEEIQEILDNPSIGTEKRGDLKGVYIHKFKVRSTQHLLAYRFMSDGLELVTIGPHENYYRDLKTYMKRR